MKNTGRMSVRRIDFSTAPVAEFALESARVLPAPAILYRRPVRLAVPSVSAICSGGCIVHGDAAAGLECKGLGSPAYIE